jgi:hypothetical protein
MTSKRFAISNWLDIHFLTIEFHSCEGNDSVQIYSNNTTVANPQMFNITNTDARPRTQYTLYRQNLSIVYSIAIFPTASRSSKVLPHQICYSVLIFCVPAEYSSRRTKRRSLQDFSRHAKNSTWHMKTYIMKFRVVHCLKLFSYFVVTLRYIEKYFRYKM